ncbi:MAG: type II toxin-antitoxin system VapC family toxin [Pyrinomonadaceae bacterium]|nr:type II toxin-antitoxin system VapC family toxin [Pyrinomonadaceae bacterium]
MGQLVFPLNTKVYLDTSPIIYSVEKHTDYWQILAPFWQLLKAGEFEVYTSELTLLETLVQPIKQNNQILISAYENLLIQTDIRLLPISLDVLRESANLRAKQNFKTPDAIHASTAFSVNCEYFVTNDDGFKRLSNINVIILNDLI